MTEKEKMQKQMLYDANHDETLLHERVAAKELCHQYNLLRPSDEQGQRELMRRLLGKTKGAFCIVAPFWCDYGCNIEIGENFFANHNTVILDGAKVTFGSNVFIAPTCGFYTAGHPIDFERRNPGLEYAYSITVGDNVWFGAGVQVMPGVTIGEGAQVAAGAIVTHDVEPYMTVAGSPAKPMRERKTDGKRGMELNHYYFRGRMFQQD